MPKAEKTNWVGYWEPAPRNQVTVSRADRATSVYDRDVAFRQSQRDALAITTQDGGPQRGQQREAALASDDDSDNDIFHTPKAMRMKLDDEDETEMESTATVTQDPADETEQQQENENPASQATPIEEKFLDIQERLAAMEDKVQSLDETTEKNVDDINYLLPRTTELASVGQATMKRVDKLTKALVTIESNMSKMLELQEALAVGSDQAASLCSRLFEILEKTMKDLETTTKALEETMAAQVEGRATISSLQKELSEMRG